MLFSERVWIVLEIFLLISKKIVFYWTFSFFLFVCACSILFVDFSNENFLFLINRSTSRTGKTFANNCSASYISYLLEYFSAIICICSAYLFLIAWKILISLFEINVFLIIIMIDSSGTSYRVTFLMNCTLFEKLFVRDNNARKI